MDDNIFNCSSGICRRISRATFNWSRNTWKMNLQLSQESTNKDDKLNEYIKVYLEENGLDRLPLEAMIEIKESLQESIKRYGQQDEFMEDLKFLKENINNVVSVSKIRLIITFFDPAIGPKLFFNFPEFSTKDKLMSQILESLFDVSAYQDQLRDDASFEFSLINSDMKFVNNIFSLPNENRRGRVDMVMITIMTRKENDSAKIHNLLKNIIKGMKEVQDESFARDFYMIFHRDNRVSDLERDMINARIRFFKDRIINNILDKIIRHEIVLFLQYGI